MDNIIDEIKTHFAANLRGFRRIKSISDWETFTYRHNCEFGLAIKYDSGKDIYEEANEVILYSTILVINNRPDNYLMLACCNEQYRNKFAELSRDFVDPGVNGEKRINILSDPNKWWNSWVGLLGDRKADRKSYDTIAELLTLDYLYKDDKSTLWTASEAGTHDIETDKESYEVKSTIKKSETTVTISSQHQLESSNNLFLIYIRMEKSLSGYSINDVVASLTKHGYDDGLLESQLSNRGFKKGSSIRDLKYTVLETRLFTVDGKFPKIVESSFKNDVFPKNIVKILYTIDLEGINYSAIKIHENDSKSRSAGDDYPSISEDTHDFSTTFPKNDNLKDEIRKKKASNGSIPEKDHLCVRLKPQGSMLDCVLDDNEVEVLVNNLMNIKDGTTILEIVVECQKEFQERYFSMNANEWRHLIGDYVRNITKRWDLKDNEKFTFKVA